MSEQSKKRIPTIEKYPKYGKRGPSASDLANDREFLPKYHTLLISFDALNFYFKHYYDI